MGNHLVGAMFATGLQYLNKNEISNLTQKKALEILDKIGKKVIESTSLDAEFDDEANPNQPLGQVIIKAFKPDFFEKWKNLDVFDDDDEAEIWSNEVYQPFRDRFGFW